MVEPSQPLAASHLSTKLSPHEPTCELIVVVRGAWHNIKAVSLSSPKHDPRMMIVARGTFREQEVFVGSLVARVSRMKPGLGRLQFPLRFDGH